MKNFMHTFITFSLAAILLYSCNRDEPASPRINLKEAITTMNITLSPQAGGTTVLLTYRDLDGVGGNDPVIISGVLEPLKTYDVSIQLLNTNEEPPANVTTEIGVNKDDYQFFFQTDVRGMTIRYNDQDLNRNPIGLKSIWQTEAPASGTITVTLKRGLDKGAPGVKGGDPANAGGETDLEVTFRIDVV